MVEEWRRSGRSPRSGERQLRRLFLQHLGASLSRSRDTARAANNSFTTLEYHDANRHGRRVCVCGDSTTYFSTLFAVHERLQEECG
jgi:hypothetical protein